MRFLPSFKCCIGKTGIELDLLSEISSIFTGLHSEIFKWQLWHHGTLTNGIRGSLQGKQICYWSKSENMQLAVQCQINNGGHLQLRSSLFCTAQSAFAVEICAQMGQIAGMAWKNSSGTSLLLERLQTNSEQRVWVNLSLFFVAPRHPGLFATTRWGYFYRQCVASRLMHDDAEDQQRWRGSN